MTQELHETGVAVERERERERERAIKAYLTFIT